MVRLRKIKPMTDKDEIERRVRDAGARAQAEAEARRAGQKPMMRPREINGPKGPEHPRFGDWEKKGIASDF